MSLINSWYPIDEAAAKYGLSAEQINHWIDNGLVRTEGGNGNKILVNVEDIEQELHQISLV